ncbi:contractile injection system protein, VgrG/Pvc8 family, partial [uncultured Marinobacter sp.]|uniref:contractile injection system protein, VgrG/Pvc8 family n=1 Tax=uncultured Marinobacter sp. TaxID=187379 RepID=UPI0030DB16F8
MVKETQHHFLRIHSSLGDDALVLESLNACEGLSRLFDIWVIFTANERIEDMKPLIGEPVSVSLVLGDNASEPERFFHGHFLSVRELGKPLHNGEGQRYQAQIVPRAWSATSRTNCRIFQDQTALD